MNNKQVFFLITGFVGVTVAGVAGYYIAKNQMDKQVALIKQNFDVEMNKLSTQVQKQRNKDVADYNWVINSLNNQYRKEVGSLHREIASLKIKVNKDSSSNAA